MYISIKSYYVRLLLLIQVLMQQGQHELQPKSLSDKGDGGGEAGCFTMNKQPSLTDLSEAAWAIVLP